MIKFIIMGFWVLLVTLGGLFIGRMMSDDSSVEPVNIEIEGQSKRDQDLTDVINIPVLVAGQVKGYILVQLSFVMDEQTKSELDLSIKPFVNDAVFAEFFGAYTDVSQVERVRFEPSRERIIENVNQRFGTPVVKDLLVQQFNFITSENLRKKQQSSR